MAVRPIHMIARKILLFVGLCLALVASASELSQPVTQTDVQQLQQQIQVFDKELAVLKEVTSNRLDAQDKRVGDIGLWTGQQANYMATISNHSTLVGIGITVITIAVGFLAFISTRNRAITEAKAASASWFSEKSIELNKEIDILRKKALSAQKEVDDHVIETKLGINKIAADTTKNLSELVIKAAENIINQPNSSQSSQEDLDTVKLANQNLEEKPEIEFTAEEHFVRATADYSAKRFESALISIEKAIRKSWEESISAEMHSKYINARAVILSALNRHEEALMLLDHLEQCFSHDTTPLLDVQFSKIIVNKGLILNISERYEDAIEVFNKIISLFSQSDLLLHRQHFSKALIGKIRSLKCLNKLEVEDEIKFYNEIENRNKNETDVTLQEHLAIALVSKGIIFGSLEKHDDEIAEYNKVIKKFDNEKSATLRQQFAYAVFNKGVVLKDLKRTDEAIDSFQTFLQKYAKDNQHEIRELVDSAQEYLNELQGTNDEISF